MNDPVFWVSALLLAFSVAVIAWAAPAWAKLRAAREGKAPEWAAPLEELRAGYARLAETVKTLDLTHVQALQTLGGRLDRIEADAQNLKADFSRRLESVEGGRADAGRRVEILEKTRSILEQRTSSLEVKFKAFEGARPAAAPPSVPDSSSHDKPETSSTPAPRPISPPFV